MTQNILACLIQAFKNDPAGLEPTLQWVMDTGFEHPVFRTPLAGGNIAIGASIVQKAMMSAVGNVFKLPTAGITNPTDADLQAAGDLVTSLAEALEQDNPPAELVANFKAAKVEADRISRLWQELNPAPALDPFALIGEIRR